jgi:DNA gyrase/topoisomerase IV subunit B
MQTNLDEPCFRHRRRVSFTYARPMQRARPLTSTPGRGAQYETQICFFDSRRHGAGTELFIVEGDSAAGIVRSVRDDDTQAVFSVQGKIPNALRTSATKVSAHATCKALIEVLGPAPTSSEPDAARFERVIVCTDGDADGMHIQALVTVLFAKLLKPWVEHGHLFTVRPPLFRVEAEGHDARYAYTPDQCETLRERFAAAGFPNPTVTRFRGLSMLESHEVRLHCTNAEKRHLRAVNPESAEATIATMQRFLAP